MNCYYHPDREAVDICHICNKHICTECKAILTDKVICNQCMIAVSSRVKRELKNRQEAEDRRFAYVLPVLSTLISLTFFVLFAVSRVEVFAYIGAIILAIAIIFFIMARTYVKREIQESEKTKPTKRKVIGWILIGFGALSLALLPALAFLPIEMGVWSTILLIMISFMCIILGTKLAKW